MSGATIRCRRCSAEGPALPWPPYAGDDGETIAASICATCWAEWVEVQTKMINEYRLNVLDAAHQKRVAEECMIFLGLREGEASPVPGVPPDEGSDR